MYSDVVESIDMVRVIIVGSVRLRVMGAAVCGRLSRDEAGEVDREGRLIIDGLPIKTTWTMRAISSQLDRREEEPTDPSSKSESNSSKSEKSSAEEDASSSEERYTMWGAACVSTGRSCSSF